MITELFNTLLYQPLLNVLVLIYNIIPDFGLSIIILTALVRLALFPINRKALASQASLKKLQPKMKEIKEKHQDDKMKQSQALMELYQEQDVSPFSSFLPILIQLPILIALFRVFLNGFGGSLDLLYSFVPSPETISPMFLGLIDLSKTSLVFAVLAGGFQFLQTKIVSGKTSKFIYFMPVLTIFIGTRLPAGLPLYWMTITVLAILQFKFHERYSKDKQKEECTKEE